MDDEELFYLLSTERKGGLWWWKQSEYGYTQKLAEAGKFPRERAFDICRLSGYQDVPVPAEAMEDWEGSE